MGFPDWIAINLLSSTLFYLLNGPVTPIFISTNQIVPPSLRHTFATGNTAG